MTQLSELTYADLRRRCNELVQAAGEWAGAPMPVEGIPLVLEKRYPYQGLNGYYHGPHNRTGLKHGVPVPAESDPGVKIRNSWRSSRRRGEVLVVEVDGQVRSLFTPDDWSQYRYATNMILHTLGSSDAWSLEAEFTALESLRGLLTDHAFKCYLTTGTFLESSERSGVCYIFRRLRPTIALMRSKYNPANLEVSCALCMHPIGYYQNTWAGCMVPTDDVIAHLVMMRGDEHLFWRKCNQHRPQNVQAGIC